jgi:hypothetical protein
MKFIDDAEKIRRLDRQHIFTTSSLYTLGQMFHTKFQRVQKLRQTAWLLHHVGHQIPDELVVFH